jgi:hypothetical protein
MDGQNTSFCLAPLSDDVGSNMVRTTLGIVLASDDLPMT